MFDSKAHFVNQYIHTVTILHFGYWGQTLAFLKLSPTLPTHFHSVYVSSWRVRHIQCRPTPTIQEWKWLLKPHSDSTLMLTY